MTVQCMLLHRLYASRYTVHCKVRQHSVQWFAKQCSYKCIGAHSGESTGLCIKVSGSQSNCWKNKCTAAAPRLANTLEITPVPQWLEKTKTKTNKKTMTMTKTKTKTMSNCWKNKCSAVPRLANKNEQHIIVPR